MPTPLEAQAVARYRYMMQWLADLSPQVGSALMWLGKAGLVLLLLPPLLFLKQPIVTRAAAVLTRIIDGTSTYALRGAMGMAIIMVLAQLAVVIARHVFGLAFSWLNEIVIYGFAAMFLLAASSALRDDAHVRVDILRPRSGPKGRAIVDLAGAYLFIFPIGALIIWAVTPSLSRSWAGLEGSRESDGLPILFLFKTLIPIFATLMMAQGLSQALKAALGLAGLAPLEPEKTEAVHGA